MGVSSNCFLYLKGKEINERDYLGMPGEVMPVRVLAMVPFRLLRSSVPVLTVFRAGFRSNFYGRAFRDLRCFRNRTHIYGPDRAQGACLVTSIFQCSPFQDLRNRISTSFQQLRSIWPAWAPSNPLPPFRKAHFKSFVPRITVETEAKTPEHGVREGKPPDLRPSKRIPAMATRIMGAGAVQFP